MNTANTGRHRILITGASGAVGGALAREYASAGVELVLLGRQRDLLEAVGADCRASGAQTIIQCLDVRNIESLREWAIAQPPFDLLIANAGMNINVGPDGNGEAWADSDTLLTVNLRATVALVEALLPAMRARKSGQIALVSSLAGYFGLPVTPSYCASKAALKAYGEALRGWLAPEGIRVNVVMPGYVESPMCHAMPGPKPFLWTAERAARVISRGLARNKARISFPFPLNFGTWFLAVLPAAFSHHIVRWMGYGR